MSERYEMWTPAQAADRLAADLPGGRADAEQVVASYLWDATGVHGRPSSGWRMDEFDLDDARARFGWVDFAGGETVAQARARADAAAVAALREARGTSAITDRTRLFGLHSDAEMWGYRAHQVGLDELTNTTACDPQPRLVTVAREGRERSHREACAVHDARQAATEATAEVAALDEHSNDRAADDGPADQSEADRVDPKDDRDRAAQDARVEMETGERGDRERVLDEGPGSFVGGLWFTPDPAVEGGIRPLTDTEMRRVSDLVRATQAEALAEDLAPHDIPSSAPRADDHATEWGR
ncbi:hypothetical protein ND486_09025 [Pseudonocardia sp. DR1-2]|uniref:hypothetical protein n=1 Tax=Pseudonocardia sp. DR1-2 TaxID=2951168 RepID=UPI002042FBA6|nr:hypothetical protein [Pseudonocardia sp. DR1-2]MCM3846333.1 hypothetical protein [Pseudonocardia sp. DR1-2]